MNSEQASVSCERWTVSKPGCEQWVVNSEQVRVWAVSNEQWACQCEQWAMNSEQARVWEWAMNSEQARVWAVSKPNDGILSKGFTIQVVEDEQYKSPDTSQS